MEKAKAFGLSLLIAITVAIAIGTTSIAWADEDKAVPAAQPTATGIIEVNGVEYGSLEEAILAVPADKPAKIKLLDNVTIPDGTKLTLSTDVTIALNGYTLTSKDGGDRPIYVKSTGSITIDGTAAGSSVVLGNSASYGLLEAELGADITLKGGSYTGDTTNGSYFRTTAPAAGETKVILENLTVKTNYSFFKTSPNTIPSGSDFDLQVIGGSYTSDGLSQIFYTDTIDRYPVTFDGVTATVNGGSCVVELAGSHGVFRDCDFTVNGTNANNYSDTAVFVGFMGKATIESGSYTSKGHGAYIGTSGGEIEVTGGTVQGDKGSIQADADGNTYEGAESNVTISGGTIQGDLGGVTHGKATSSFTVTGGKIDAEFALKENGEGGDASAVVSGGSFTNPVPEDLLAPGFSLGEPDENGNYNVHEHEWTTSLNSDETGHWHECAKCGAKDAVAPHEAAAELSGVVDATCGEDGYTGDKVCKDCGFVLDKGEIIPASGNHTFNGWTSDDNDHWHACAVCNKSFDTAAHTFGDWTVTKEASTTEDGMREHTCTVCGATVSEAIPATGTNANADDNATEDSTILAKTSDSSTGIAVGAFAAVVAAASVLAFALRRSKQH